MKAVCCFIGFFPLLLFAQSKFTGSLKDENGKPVAGATVKVKNKAGVVALTDSLGRFWVQAQPGDTLQINSVGVEMTEMAINNIARGVPIVLKSSARELDDMVVIAYGNTSKKLVSNAVSTISGRQMENMPVASPAEAMVGLAAGVLVGTPSGEPGSNPWIRVRGLGSLGAGNNPLFVVDGYPLNSADNFYNINGQDVESIQILKDAASSAMYGSRGANGIVMVTTKRGTGNSKGNFAFNAYTGIAQVTKKIKLLDGPQYIAYLKEAYTNGKQTIPAVFTNGTAVPANTDWQDEIFRTGIQNSFSLSAWGGSEASRYYISGNYFKQTGVVTGSGFSRMLLRANYDAKLSKKLKIGMTLAPSVTVTDTKPISGNFNNANISGGGPGNLGATVTGALLLPPVWGIRFPNGDYEQPGNSPYNVGVNLGGLFNPVATLDLYKDKTTSFRGLGYLFADYQILKGLSFKTNLGGEIINNRRSWLVPATLATTSAAAANLSNPILANINARQQNNTSNNWVWENILTYTGRIGAAHRYTLLAGYSAQKNIYEGQDVFGQNGTYTNSTLEYVTAAGQIFGSAAANGNALSSMFARLDYNYKLRYIFSASLRQDGSSRFGSDNRYATFPAGSFAWRISEEAFMKPIRKKLKISELKLRASIGLTGNNNIGDYSWQSYQVPANANLGTGSGVVVYGLAPNSVSIKNLSWEKSRQVDVGVDIGLFRNKVNINVDWYQRNTTSLLLNRNVPSVIGYTNRVFSNVGEVRNRGLDVGISSQVITRKTFTWSVDANIYFFRNKVMALTSATDRILFDAVFGYTSSIRVVPGEAMGDFYGYRQAGVFRDAADVAAGPVWAAGGSAPGDIKYEDINGDKKIDDKDIVKLGSPFPDFSYGVTNALTLKGFQLMIGIQGNQGGKVLNGGDRYMYNFFGKSNAPAFMLNRWQSPEQPGDGNIPRVTTVPPSSITNFSTRQLYDATFLRIKSVQFRYSLPQTLVKRAKMQKMSVYVSAQNLFTFSGYYGYNPEANLYGNSVNPTYGVDQGSYPLNRIVTLGINATF